MAAMFRKSGNRKFRRKNFNLNEDDEDGNENISTDVNVVNAVSKEPKLKSSTKTEKTATTNSLLSFDHDENDEETEVFQVKKSKESRRLSKKLSKDKHKKIKPRMEIKDEEDGDEENHEISGDEKPHGNNGVDPGKLEALRAELREMSKGDEDDENEEEDDFLPGKEEDKPPIFSRRSEFNIPDAKTIHALKKKREMARQLGTGQDYIPLDESQRYEGRFDSKSRLIREDENDASDDDGPMSFSAVKNDHLEIFNERESENEEENEEDEETKRWEDEQIRKGVSASQVQQEKEQHGLDPSNYQAYNIYPYGGGYSIDATQNLSESQKPQGRFRGTTTEKPTLESILTRLRGRLEQLQGTYRGRMVEKDKIVTHSSVSEDSIEKLTQHGIKAERDYSFYQETRGYVRDLIECLNEKAPLIETIEKSMHDLFKQRAQRLVDRRQEDVKDQSDEFLALQTGKQKQTVKPIIDEFGRDMTMYFEECKRRRAADREGRRMRRRRRREEDGTVNITHHEGLSTDDEETETDSRQFKAESERITQMSQNIFEDVIDQFSSIKSVKEKFEMWKQECGETYKSAYISLCLPKLFSLYVRIELITWNPLTDESSQLEDMKWYQALIGFGFHSNQDIDAQDDDVKTIPSLIEKAVIPKLTEFAQHIWDPLSTKQTKNLVQLIQTLCEDYPTVQAENKTTRKLFTTIVSRLQKAVNDDVYVPLYPKQLLENKSLGVLAFFQRQYWSCFKLFRNIILWDGLLSPTAMQKLAIDGLLNRYMILGLQHSTLYYDSLEKCKMISNLMPKSWLSKQTDNTLPTLETFCRFLLNLVSCLHRSTAGCSDLDKKKARSATKKIIQYLLSLKAKDKASSLARDHGLEELIGG